MFTLLSDLRAWLIRQVGRPLAKRHESLYVTTTTHHTEFVGILRRDEQGAIDLLKELGAEPNYLAAFKTLRGTDDTEIGSWAWRGTVGDPSDPDSWEQDSLADKQLHIILYELDDEDDTTAVFAHWEYSWLTNPVKHYRGVDIDDAGGRQMLCARFKAADVDFIPHDNIAINAVTDG